MASKLPELTREVDYGRGCELRISKLKCTSILATSVFTYFIVVCKGAASTVLLIVVVVFVFLRPVRFATLFRPLARKLFRRDLSDL